MSTLLQRLFSYVWPPYKFELRRGEQRRFISALLDSLPSQFDYLREQFKVAKFWGIGDWPTKPDFRFITQFFPPNTINDFTVRGRNLCIKGLRVYSNRSGRFEDIDLILRNGLLIGLCVSNGNYDFAGFDLTRIENTGVRGEPFEFGPDEIEIFYESLDPEIKRLLKLEDMFDVQPNNRTYYVFYDLEDGNYLATDRMQKVYSLVHDARPIVRRMNKSLLEILKDIESGDFDNEKHLEQRYSRSRS